MSEIIRVLQIGMHDQMGGIENFIMNYYRNMDKSKIQFDFLIPYKNGSNYDNEIEELGGKIFKFTFKNDKNIFKFLKDLNCFFKNNRYDIVHCNDTGLGAIYLFFAKKYNCKIRIAHSHANSEERNVKGFLKKILQKIYVKYANTYFACSKEAGDYLFKRKDYLIIKNAIDYEKYKFNKELRNEIREKLNFNDNDIVIGNIGRLCEQKNQLFLLDVFKELPRNYKLLIIGAGELKKAILKKIKRYNLFNRTILLSPEKDVYKYYNAMDIFVLPSIYEGLGIVLIEGQASGLPCLTSDKVVPAEAKISECLKFVSLDGGATFWANQILSQNITRVETKEDIIKAKYSLKDAVKELENIYIEILNKDREKK